MIARGWQKTVGVVALALLLGLPAAANGALDAARGHFKAGRYLDAVRVLQSGLEESPRDARLFFWLSRCYFELHDWQKAIHYAESALKLDSKNSDYHYWLGRAYAEKADDERSLSSGRKAKGEWEEAVRLNPQNVDARFALMEYLAQAPWIAGGSDGDARKQVEAIAALDPVRGQTARARYWWANEKWDRAEAAYRKLLEMKPQNPDPYFDAADFYRKRRDATGLKAATDAAARVSPSDPRLDYFRGVLHVISGQGLEEGERQLLSYIRKVPPRSDHPPHAAAHEWLGKLYEKMGKCREAVQHFRAALQLDSQLRDAKDALNRLKCS